MNGYLGTILSVWRGIISKKNRFIFSGKDSNPQQNIFPKYLKPGSPKLIQVLQHYFKITCFSGKVFNDSRKFSLFNRMFLQRVACREWLMAGEVQQPCWHWHCSPVHPHPSPQANRISLTPRLRWRKSFYGLLKPVKLSWTQPSTSLSFAPIFSYSKFFMIVQILHICKDLLQFSSYWTPLSNRNLACKIYQGIWSKTAGV